MVLVLGSASGSVQLFPWRALITWINSPW